MTSSVVPSETAVLEQHARRYLDQVQRLAKLGSYDWDLRRGEMRWSTELHHVLGVAAGDAPTTIERYLAVVHPEDRERVGGIMRRAAARGEAYAMDHRIVRSDGLTRWLRCRGNVLLEDGEPAWLYGVKLDITEEKSVEQALHCFVDDAAHELRTPIATIGHASELLRSGGLGDPERRAVVDVLLRQAERLRSAAERLLDLTALEQGIDTVLLRRIPVAPAIREAMARVALDGRDVAVEVEDGLQVRADRDHLVELVRELLDHAARCGGGRVTISARRDGPEVLLVVEDDGPGMPGDEVPVLFIPIRRGLRRRGHWTSPGLSNVRRIATSFGGAVHYEAVEPHGSRFVVRLESPRPGEGV